MNLGPVLNAALEAQAACQKLGLPSCVIGGVALQRWGEPRFTADADLSVSVEPGDEERVADALLGEMSPRIEDAACLSPLPRDLKPRAHHAGIAEYAGRAKSKERDLAEHAEFAEKGEIVGAAPTPRDQERHHAESASVVVRFHVAFVCALCGSA